MGQGIMTESNTPWAQGLANILLTPSYILPIPAYVLPTPAYILPIPASFERFLLDISPMLVHFIRFQ